MTIAKEMTTRLRKAARYITKHGWTQGTEKDSRGRVCATGAIRLCAPVDGDFFLVREVLRGRGRAEDWNDAPGRTDNQVIRYLATAVVTDADLAGTFGPQWVGVVALVRRAVTLTPVEALDVVAARASAGYSAAYAARILATRAAARTERSLAAATAAGAAATAAGAARGPAARGAAADVARSLAVRDLIGQHGFTQAHYDTLTGPWRKVIGPVHPDDAAMIGDKP